MIDRLKMNVEMWDVTRPTSYRAKRSFIREEKDTKKNIGYNFLNKTIAVE